MDKKFTLRFLPLFEQDLAAASDYIARVLKNPSAAIRLVEETEKAILNRLTNPLAFEPFRSAKGRNRQYYRIRIKNYTVFYVVIDDVMEVRRFIFSSRDLPRLL